MIKRLIFLLIVFAALALPKTSYATPTLFHWVGCSDGSGSAGITTMHCWLTRPTLAGDSIYCTGQHGWNATLPSLNITDDKGDSFTIEKHAKTTGNSNQIVWSAFFGTATTGSQEINIVLSAARSNNKAACAEVAGANSVDVCSTAATFSGSGAISGPSLAVTGSGDLIINMAEEDVGAAITAWTTETQSNITWNTIDYYLGYGNNVSEFVQYGVYNSSSAIAPQFGIPAGGYTGLTLACALKPSATGTAAPAFDVQGRQSYNVQSGTTTIVGANGTGNFGAITIINASGSGVISGISGSVTGAWVKLGKVLDGGSGSGDIDEWYHSGTLSVSDLLTISFSSGGFNTADITVTVTQGGTGLDTGMTAGASTTCSSGFCNASGTQSSGTSFTGGVVTNTAAAEIILAATGANSPQQTGVNSGPFVPNITSSPQEGSSGDFDENNGHFNVLTTSVTSQTLSVLTSAAVAGWQTVFIGIEGPSATQATPPLFVIQQ